MQPGERTHRHNVPDARSLRRKMTPTETTLWSALRRRQFQGLKFRRQHPVDNFVLDFYCHEHMLAIEVDGPVHRDPAQKERDQTREEILRQKGIRILHISAELVETDLDAVLEQIAAATTDPSPRPSPAAREREH